MTARTGHHWAKIGTLARPSWMLAPLGPGEVELLRGRTVSGPSYECDRCGVVHMKADVLHVDEEGDRHWRRVTLYGWDWDALTPMRSPPACEVFARPEGMPVVELVDEQQLALDLQPGVAA